ncbi:hypothetical protein BDV96DRAFT_677464 [Lophiotrema nucula]|uniref:BTB domain-containing protein n=1 Tax=Lophiotrema nucula TaxID=690887 RepID=A0A6A5ZHI7_9PLEO|nr:hypothetical protein BDV96DRAFT_677464 [Lophiotrema nucula]
MVKEITSTQALSRSFLFDFRLPQAEHADRVFQLLSLHLVKSPYLTKTISEHLKRSPPAKSQTILEIKLPGVDPRAFELYTWWLNAGYVPFNVWAPPNSTETVRSLQWNDCAELVQIYILNANFKDENFRRYLISELKKWLAPGQVPNIEVIEYVFGVEDEKELHDFVVDHMLSDKAKIQHVLKHLVRKALMSGAVGMVAPIAAAAVDARHPSQPELKNALGKRDSSNNHAAEDSGSESEGVWGPLHKTKDAVLRRSSTGSIATHRAQMMSMPNASQYGGMQIDGELHALLEPNTTSRPASAGQIMRVRAQILRPRSAQLIHIQHPPTMSVPVPNGRQFEKPLPQTPAGSALPSPLGLSVARKAVGSGTRMNVRRKPTSATAPVELVGSATTELANTEVTPSDLEKREQDALEEEKMRAEAFHVVLPN